jgi:hypothetical protein
MNGRAGLDRPSWRQDDPWQLRLRNLLFEQSEVTALQSRQFGLPAP